jgi:hypothetical protein
VGTEPSAQPHIRSVCDLGPAVGAQIYRAPPYSQLVERASPRPFIFIPRHSQLRYAARSRDSPDAPSPLHVLISRRPRDILFHRLQDYRHRSLRFRRINWNGVLHAINSSLRLSQLPVQHPCVQYTLVFMARFRIPRSVLPPVDSEATSFPYCPI